MYIYIYMVIKLTQLRALYSRNAHRFPIYSNGSWDPQWTCSQRFDSTASS